MNKIILNFYNRRDNAGFSLIELLVTISILALVSGFVFFNHSQFNSQVIVENLAYEISLAIRQAQSYGVQVKQTAGDFNEGYGVYFDINSDEFFIFADIYPVSTPNFIYDPGLDEVVDTLRMSRGNEVDDLCVESDCSPSSISIAFLRPNPSAVIKADSGTEIYDSANIYIISPKGVKKRIFVNRIGQISVNSVE